MNERVYSIEEIRERFNNGLYSYRVEIQNKVSESHVFDEDLSVKQNREMAIAHNNEIEKQKCEYNRRNRELFDCMRNDVIRYIMDTYSFSEKVAEIIESHVYTEKHSFMCDYFGSIDTYCDFVDSILESV